MSRCCARRVLSYRHRQCRKPFLLPKHRAAPYASQAIARRRWKAHTLSTPSPGHPPGITATNWPTRSCANNISTGVSTSPGSVRPMTSVDSCTACRCGAASSLPTRFSTDPRSIVIPEARKPHAGPDGRIAPDAGRQQMTTRKDRAIVVSALKHAAPYIRLFKGKVFVIKAGGEVFADPELTDALMEQVGILHQVGIRVVLIHGGGPQSTALARCTRSRHHVCRGPPGYR